MRFPTVLVDYRFTGFLNEVYAKVPAGDHAVEMIMVAEVLPPSMQHGGDAQGGLEVVPTKLQQGGAGAGEQQAIEAGLVVLDERVEKVGER